MKQTMLVLAILATAISPASAEKVLYFFDSAVCPVCERARGELPQMVSRHGVRIASYRLINGSGKMDESNKKSLAVMVSMLQGIDRKTGGAAFIQKDRKAYRFAASGGFPYYLNKVSEQTTVRVEMGVPVFIFGDRVFVGYNRFELEKALREGSGKAR